MCDHEINHGGVYIHVYIHAHMCICKCTYLLHAYAYTSISPTLIYVCVYTVTMYYIYNWKELHKIPSVMPSDIFSTIFCFISFFKNAGHNSLDWFQDTSMHRDSWLEKHWFGLINVKYHHMKSIPL